MSETALAVAQSVPEYLTPEKIELIKNMICPSASDDELQLFLHQCKRTGLDPLARQIYGIKRWNKDAGREVLAAQTSVDGFRLVAERTGEYEGQTPVMWADVDGNWHDVWLHKYAPVAAKVGVWRKGFREALIAVALYDDYVQLDKQQNPTKMWLKMGPLMIAKCAECLALRKAFPHELSGMYSEEEMQQAKVAEVDPDKADEKVQVERAERAAAVKIPGAVSAHAIEDKAEADFDKAIQRPAPVAIETDGPPAASKGLEGSRTGARRVTPAPSPSNPMRHPRPTLPSGTVVEGEIVPPAEGDDEVAAAKAVLTLKGSALGTLSRGNIQYLVNNEATFLKQGASLNRLEDAANCIAACKVILAH